MKERVRRFIANCLIGALNYFSPGPYVLDIPDYYLRRIPRRHRKHIWDTAGQRWMPGRG